MNAVPPPLKTLAIVAEDPSDKDTENDSAEPPDWKLDDGETSRLNAVRPRGSVIVSVPATVS